MLTINQPLKWVDTSRDFSKLTGLPVHTDAVVYRSVGRWCGYTDDWSVYGKTKAGVKLAVKVELLRRAKEHLAALEALHGG